MNAEAKHRAIEALKQLGGDSALDPAEFLQCIERVQCAGKE